MPIANTTTYSWDANWNEVAGIYFVLDATRRVIYIGETDNLKRRMGEHKADTGHLMHLYNPTHVMFEAVADEATRKRRETALISEYAPLVNR